MKFILAAALAAATLTGTASAQSSEQLALARQLTEQVGATTMAVEMIDIMAPMIRQQIAAGAPDLTEQQLDDVTAILIEEFRNSEDELMEEIVTLYASAFSEAELQAATEFYATELGQTFIERMPEVMQRGMVLGEQWGATVAQRAIPRVQAYLMEAEAAPAGEATE